jgi:hypothetical protein
LYIEENSAGVSNESANGAGRDHKRIFPRQIFYGSLENYKAIKNSICIEAAININILAHPFFS